MKMLFGKILSAYSVTGSNEKAKENTKVHKG